MGSLACARPANATRPSPWFDGARLPGYRFRLHHYQVRTRFPRWEACRLVLRPQRGRAARRRTRGAHRTARPLSRSGCHARHPGRGNHWLRRAHVRESLRRRLPHGRDRGACPRGGGVRARCELRFGHRRAGHEGPLARRRHHHRHRRERGLLIWLRVVPGKLRILT